MTQELKMDRDALSAFMARDFPQAAGLFQITHAAPMELTVRMPPNEAHLRPGGTVSGPAMFALADIAVYLAILAMIGPQALSVTTSCSMDFMRKPAAGRDVICQTRLLKLGRSLAVGDCLLSSYGDPAPVARATMTYAIPPAR
ncbi:MAG: PaaI family thioesterase [Roseinatronobacter sp.]